MGTPRRTKDYYVYKINSLYNEFYDAKRVEVWDELHKTFCEERKLNPLMNRSKWSIQYAKDFADILQKAIDEIKAAAEAESEAE
jgi:hypothetical protein